MGFGGVVEVGKAVASLRSRKREESIEKDHIFNDETAGPAFSRRFGIGTKSKQDRGQSMD